MSHRYYAVPVSYLAHHGIKGQKWGVRNGPPYPLQDTQKSVAEKRDDVLGSSMLVAMAASLAISVAFSAASSAESKVAAHIRTHKDDKLRDLNTNVDSQTGLRLKTVDATEKQDLARVNPAYEHGMFADRSTNNNCAYCSTAYFMRRKGYDVRANLNATGVDERTLLSFWKDGKFKVADGFKPGPTTAKATIDLLNKQPDGSYGYINLQWTTGIGHSMIYEKVGEKIVIRDAQSNKTHTNGASYLRSLADRGSIMNGTSNLLRSTSILRVDDLEPDLKNIKKAVS